MLDTLRTQLEEAGAFTGELPPILDKIVQAIPNRNIPLRFKQTVAVSELMLFASHLRRNIRHWDGGSIPTNSLAVILAASGEGKDSSIGAARKCFQSGYDQIEEAREEFAKEHAIQKASDAGSDMPHVDYVDHYVKPDELFAAPDSTIKGLHKHFNALEESGIGGGFVYSGEIGTELASGTIGELLKYMAEVYDTGKKEVKLIGDKGEQLKPLISLPVSGLFAGSQAAILQDDAVKKLFKNEFSSKQARRSFFCFIQEIIPDIDYTIGNEHLTPSQIADLMIADEMAIEDQALQARELINEGVAQITHAGLAKVGQDLEVSPEVRKLFISYKRYNKEKSLTISKLYPISTIVRQHLQWKAFKLSGALAIFDQSDTIEPEHYIQALNFCELLDADMALFETELVKEPYELFCSFMHAKAEESKDTKATVSLHVLRKMGYIPSSGASATKIAELVKLATSYDKHGIYTACETAGAVGICYEEIVPTTITGVSTIPVSGTKQTRAKQCAADFTYQETTFEALGAMLTHDYAYSPFQFQDGRRGKDNILGGVRWLALDIDTSTVTASEMHEILADVNHHIALTSDPDNEFKFRLLVELDAPVSIESNAWRFFLQSIADYLSVQADILPQSQIYFSYADRPIYSVIDAESIEVKDHVMFALSEAQTRTKATKPPTKAEAQALMNDPLTTYGPAFEAGQGEGSRKMIWAAYKAKELGASNEEIIDLIIKINEYWIFPMDMQRLQNTILVQIERWS